MQCLSIVRRLLRRRSGAQIHTNIFSFAKNKHLNRGDLVGNFASLIMYGIKISLCYSWMVSVLYTLKSCVSNVRSVKVKIRHSKNI